MIGISESQNLKQDQQNNFVSKFSDLLVYKRAFKISLEIHKHSIDWPKYEQYGGLADQMRRASKSISANIAEGYAKQQRSKAEFKRFLLMALGSAEEMQVWVEYAIALNYIHSTTAKEWSETYDEIVRMLQSFYSKA